MSKLDSEKEKIGVYKFWLGIIVAIFLSIVGFCITNYEKINILFLSASIFCIVFLMLLILFISTKMNKKINDLEDL